MSLESMIREAFSKKKDTEEIVKWDPDTQPNLYELALFLKKSGYRLVDMIYSGVKDTGELIIEPVTPGYLYPEIVHDIVEEGFYIKVVDQGILPVSDVESLVQGYQNAIAVIHHLNSIDLTKLEIVDDEE